MPFPKAITIVPETIEDISVTLTDFITKPGQGVERKEARYSVQVRYDSGELKVMTGDLVPHLTPGQISGLMDFMDDMRAKAEQEIL